MATLLDRIETPYLRQLYGYWDTRRGDRDFPAQRDIDPLDFSTALGHVVLLNVLNGPLRFPLSPARHRARPARRLRHDRQDGGRPAQPRQSRHAVGRCRSLIETREPVAVIRERLLGKRVFGYEAVWLPLGDDGSAISILMGGVVDRQSRAAQSPGWMPPMIA